MTASADLDAYIESLQILAHDSDADRTDEERQQDADRRTKLLDAYAHELAEKIRAEKGSSEREDAHFFHGGMDHAADLIDPKARQ